MQVFQTLDITIFRKDFFEGIIIGTAFFKEIKDEKFVPKSAVS